MIKKKGKKKKTIKRNKNKIGAVTHYFPKISVAVIRLETSLKVGDYITFETENGRFTQMVESMQVNHKNINGARKGSEIGLKVLQEVAVGSKVVKGQAPEPIVVEEKIEYQPLFEEAPKRKIAPKVVFSPKLKKREFHHPLMKKIGSTEDEIKQQKRIPPKRRPTSYNEVKFLKF